MENTKSLASMGADVSSAPISLADAQAAVEAAARFADEQFVAAYNELTHRFRRRLAGQVIIRGGQLPDIELIVTRF